MNKQIEALKMAVEALEESMPLVFGNGIALEMMKTPLLEVEQKVNFHKKAIQACKEALAEAEKQEIGEAEIRQMLKEIEWCHQELAKKEKQEPVAEVDFKDELADVLLALKEWIIKIEERLAKLEQALKEKNLDSLSS